MTANVIMRIVATILLGTATLPATAGIVYADRVENVEFGQALLHQYQGNRWRAAAGIMAADAQNRLTPQQPLGLLYLAESYAALGDRDQAETFYQQLTNTAPQEIKDQAWLAIARFAIERGDIAAARQALEQNRGNDPTAKSERMVITALALLLEGQQHAALAALSPPDEDSTWALYQRYNFGVILLREHRNPSGATVLHQLGEINSGGDPEKAALKDRANVSLGYALLQLSKPVDARQYFEKVRLDSHLSNPALLGLGWTYAMENNPPKSLVYWQTLAESDKRDSYHLESLLAIPYAYSQAAAYGQAAQHYQLAVDVFTKENNAVANAQQFIQTSGLTTSLNGTPSMETAWAEQWHPGEHDAMAVFLPLLLDNPAFQKSLQRYRLLLKMQMELGSMSRQLEQLRNHTDTDAVKTSINALSQREKMLSKQLEDGLNDKAVELETLALELLNAHHQRLEDYIRLARFGLAQVIEKTTFGETAAQ